MIEPIDARPVDPSALRLLELMASSGRRPYEELGPAEARRQSREAVASLQPDPAPVEEIRDLEAETTAGSLALRLYVGCGSGPKGGGVIFYHGGGWVVGDLETHDPLCRALANAGQCRVLAVDYRRAPEHRFPAAYKDAVAAADWIDAHAPALGIEIGRIGAAGDSAGANLAAGVAIAWRDAGKPLRALVLAYPVLDLRMNAESYRRCESGFALTTRTMRWFREQYVTEPALRLDPRASPALIGSAKGLAPTCIVTAGLDPLVDEGEAFAQRLRDAGVETTHRRYPGQMHGFLTAGRLVPEAAIEIAEIGAFLRRVL